jgi:hypothetical protein
MFPGTSYHNMADIEAIDVTLLKPSLDMFCDCLRAPGNKCASAACPLEIAQPTGAPFLDSFRLDFQSFDVSRT